MHTVLRRLYYLGGRVLLFAPKASLFEGGGFAKQRRREFSSSNPGRRSYWLGPATTTTAACGRNREELLGPWPAGCKAHSRAVAYAGSHNPSRGEGCPEGERGGVETPLSPSGPAERPRRRCRLQKPSGLPHAIALCMGNITKKHPPCGCTAGALKGSAGVLSGWCPCPQPGRRRSSQRPPRPSPGRGRSGAGPCWGCPGAC